MDVCNQLHAPAALRSVKEPLYPLDKSLGLDRSGEEKVPCICRNLDPVHFSS
jgi:hypothetical protein